MRRIAATFALITAALAAVITFLALHSSAPTSTAGQPGRRHNVTFDATGLHYTPAQWSGHCTPLHFDVTYDDGEQPWLSTFTPCDPAHFEPIGPDRCTVEHWSVYAAGVVYASGVIPSCDPTDE